MPDQARFTILVVSAEPGDAEPFAAAMRSDQSGIRWSHGTMEEGIESLLGQFLPDALLLVPLQSGEPLCHLEEIVWGLSRDLSFVVGDVNCPDAAGRTLDRSYAAWCRRRELQRTVDDIRRRYRRLDLLRGVVNELQRLQELSPVFQEIYDVFPTFLSIDRISLLLYDERLGALVSEQLIGIEHRREELESAAQPVGTSISGRCFLENRPIVINDCSTTDLIPKRFVDSLRLKSTIAVPLVCHRGAIGVLRIDNTERHNAFTDEDVEFYQTIGQVLGTAIENARLYTQTRQAEEELRALNEELENRVRERTAALEQEVKDREAAYSRIRADLETAARVQLSLIPQKPPQMQGMRFSWVFSPSEEVAGDMFNILRLDEDHAGVYMLDVTGHGVQAALFSVTIDRVLTGTTLGTSLLKDEIDHPPYYELISPGMVAAVLNRRFPFSPEVGRFFTLIYCLYDRENRRLVYTCAGHNGPILIRDGGIRRLEGPTGPAVGLLSDASFAEQVVQLRSGDRIILHTDGVDEAFNDQREEFGEERIIEALRPHAREEIDVIVQALREAVVGFVRSSTQSDDITILGFSID